MATLIQAINAYRPRVRTSRTLDLEEVVERHSRGSLVTAPVARLVVAELCAGLAECLEYGEAIRLPGIGVFRPEVRLDGTLRPRVVFEAALRRRLAAARRGRGGGTGVVGAGLDVAAVRARWDAEHPGDPVVG
ncbi:MAG: hypothetical protein ABI780_12490 [Ardenticatenales bacterium]